MGEEGEKKSARDIVHELRERQTKYHTEIKRATHFIGSVPALPANEIRQVLDHYLNIMEAIVNGNMQGAAIESARAQKHILLAIYDASTVLLQYHRDSIEFVKAVMADQARAFEAMQEAITEGVEEIRAIGVLPTEQRSNIAQTEEDIDKISQANIRLLSKLEGIETQNDLLTETIGASDLERLLKQYQTAVRSSKVARPQSSDC
jgi:DNA-directed RNA polymerase subunit F